MKFQKGWKSWPIYTNCVPSKSNSKEVNQNQLIKGKKGNCLEHPLEHTNWPILSSIAGRPVVDTWVTSVTAWQTKEENPNLCNTHLLEAKGLNAVMADPWAPTLQKVSMIRFFMIDIDEECFLTCWQLWEAKEPSFNRIRSLNSPVTCYARNLDWTRGTNAGGENTCITWCVPGWLKAFNLKAPRGHGFWKM